MLKSSLKAAAVILAAGKGTRMKSEKAKVLHEINGKPMIGYVVESASEAIGNKIVVVVGHQKEDVRKAVSSHKEIIFAEQNEQLGTGHAVMSAMPFIAKEIDAVIILCGDVPLITSDTIGNIVKAHEESGADLTLLAVSVENPAGYGRIIINDRNEVAKIVEEADANQDEKKVRLINAGIYCVERKFLQTALAQLENNNSQQEYYLTDIVSIGYSENKKINSFISDNSGEVIGVNTLQDLENAAGLLNKS